MKQPRPVSRITTAMKTRGADVAVRLATAYPGEPKPALNFTDPYQCVAAISLSAQTTDANVNKVTPMLFAAYPTTAELARADLADVERIIHSLGFFHNKARNLIRMARMVEDQFDGTVPRTMDELMELPGVARKTANLVMIESYGICEGIAVDTHVFRVAHRLGLSHAKTPQQTEGDLLAVFPREQWRYINFWMIHLGRAVCDARKPACATCPLLDICPRKGVL